MEFKTSKNEFNDRSHHNKKGFEGKKLSGKEFLAIEAYQRVCEEGKLHAKILYTVFLPRFSRLFCFFSSRIPQNNLLDLYLVKFCRYNLSFFAKSATKSWPHFSILKVDRGVKLITPGAGTSQIYLCAKFGGNKK